ncbi:META domain-containing protein [Pengzhenrongella frigida]|uniref:META domain-containing protein n=1 Tax=Pengzhenrongella frigida TaxID=1259133 RepID=A0A4Q5MWX7_9MICO|nr:META domain-containing protein [Cellulomonas sp. HLT2-17]RYV50096.1 META domain-containing protein [Cellulomonas sp. HLT2-17]
MRATSRVILVGLGLLVAGTAVFMMTRGDDDPLDGSSWVLTDWSEDGIDPAEFAITAEFADGRLAGSSGVNRYTGGYTATSAGEFSVSEVASTMMAGPEPAMAAEAAYLELLASARGFRIEGDRLALLDAEDQEMLTFATGPDATAT